MKAEFEKALKKKLKEDGVKSEWIEKHLIIETLDEEEDDGEEQT